MYERAAAADRNSRTASSDEVPAPGRETLVMEKPLEEADFASAPRERRAPSVFSKFAEAHNKEIRSYRYKAGHAPEITNNAGESFGKADAYEPSVADGKITVDIGTVVGGEVLVYHKKFIH